MLSYVRVPHLWMHVMTTWKSRRKALRDFGKPALKPAAREIARRLREEETRRRRIAAAIEVFRVLTPDEYSTLHRGGGRARPSLPPPSGRLPHAPAPL